MITKEMVRSGLNQGVIRLVKETPELERGTMCSIGEYKFYFGEELTEDLSPEEYKRVVPFEDVVREIFETLEAFRLTQGFSDEYGYYEAVLRESLGPERKPSVRDALLFPAAVSSEIRKLKGEV